MINRLPFYMVYDTESIMTDDRWERERRRKMPEQESLMEDWLERRDYDYMRSAYPDTAKRIMPYVEEACERLEYNGSMMFDEYPDQLQMRLLCRRIYDKVKDEEKNPGKWLMDLIQVMTWQEILRRRSEHRKYRRKFY